MSLKQRLASLLLSDDYHRLQAEAAAYREAYQRLPALLAPGSDTLAEIDQQYLDILTRYAGEYDILYGQVGPGYQPTEAQRIRTVYRARRAFILDPSTDGIIRTWLNFAFGLNVEVVPKDETEQTLDDKESATAVWDEYFTARRNRALFGAREIGDLNDTLLNDGELFFLNFINTLTGRITTRLIPTEEIPADGIICDPDDRRKPLYYKRQSKNRDGGISEVFYPDWAATDKELERAKLPENANLFTRDGTRAVVLHVAFNRKVRGSLRGWPLMTAGMDWTLAYKENLQDQAAVARAVAMVVNKLKIKGGSRAISTLKSQFGSSLVSGSGALETNPPAVAGSWFPENEAVDLQRMPLTTGARDNAVTSAALLGQALTGAGNLPLEWFARGDVNTYAQANSANIPAFRTFNRYQLFWSSVWSDLCEIVLMAYSETNGVKYETYEAAVNLDSPLEPELTALTTAAGAFMRDVVTPLAGRLPDEAFNKIVVAVIRLVLQSLGVRNGADLIDEEMFTQLVQPTQPAAAPTTSPNGVVPTQPAAPQASAADANAPENLESTKGLNGAQLRSVIEVLIMVSDGAIAPAVAVSLLTATGIDRTEAQRMVDETLRNPTKQVDKVVSQAMENYRNGDATADDVAEFLLAQFIEDRANGVG